MSQEEIPRSIIKGSGFYNIELGNDLEKRGGKVLLINADAVLIGIKDIPYHLFATPSFNIKKLPINGINQLPADIEKTLFEVQEMYLLASFENYSFSGKVPPKLYPQIPNWLKDFKNLTNLSFNHINIDSLSCLKNSSIETLTFKDIEFNDYTNVILAIKEFKQLKTIVCDQSLLVVLTESLNHSSITLKELPVSQ